MLSILDFLRLISEKVYEYTTRPLTPLQSTSAATNCLFYSIRRAVTPEAMQSGRGDPCSHPCCPANNTALGIWLKKIFLGGTPIPAQGASAPYVSSVYRAVFV